MAVEMRPMNQTFGDENLFDARSHYAAGNDPNHNENGKCICLFISSSVYLYRQKISQCKIRVCRCH